MRSEPAPTPSGEPRVLQHTRYPGADERASERSARAAQAAEDDERVLRQRFVDELPARLGLTVQPSSELVRLVFRRRADEDVRVAADNAVAFRFELIGQRLCLLGRACLDSDLPWREALVDHVLLGLEFLRRLGVPP